MARQKLNEEDKRRTVPVSLKNKHIKQLDDFIRKEKEKRPYMKISRQTVLEGLTLDFLEKEGEEKQ